MLNGTVNPFREAVIRLEIRGPQGQSEEVEAILDTGYDSYLTLPLEIINRLGLPYRGTGEAELADGSPAFFDIYVGTVIWDGRPWRISIDQSETAPLVGMHILYGHTLTIHVIDGGDVTIL